jgi:hypothetical protein
VTSSADFLASLDGMVDGFKKYSDKTPRWLLHDGISNNGLKLWLTCKEQFRLKYVEGWRRPQSPKKAADFGTMFHKLVEYGLSPVKEWDACLTLLKGESVYDEVLAHKAIAVYIGYWNYHGEHDVANEFIQWEKEFYFPYYFDYAGQRYCIPLYGFMDRVEFNSVKKKGVVGDTKTRAKLDIANTEIYLHSDLQTKMYCLAHEYMFGKLPQTVMYDLVLHPGTEPNLLSRKKGETARESPEQYHNRVAQDCLDDPKSYYHRIHYSVFPTAFEKYRSEVLHPLFVDFIKWWCRLVENGFRKQDYANPVALKGQYGPCELYHLVTNGSTQGLTREEPKRRDAKPTPKFQVPSLAKDQATGTLPPIQDPHLWCKGLRQDNSHLYMA